MILEAIITTTNDDGSMNVSPMGPWIENDPADGFELRPFDTSRTFANLQQRPAGVLHVTDDVMLFAQAAIGQLKELPAARPAEKVDGFILQDACRWYEFEAVFFDTTQPRKNIRCQTIASGRQRDFWGFNRAKFAVLEAAILATRVNFLPLGEIEGQLPRLKTIVEKTGGDPEKAAFALIERFVENS